jgi:triphosphoribosyl-dephospho-CoA synthetase
MRPRERLAADLVDGARRELRLTPKPGLVDLDDSGSHPDLSLALMERSLEVLGGVHADLAASLERGEALSAQAALGRAGEARLLACCGTNTHKGALFLGGLLLAARWRSAADLREAGALRPGVRDVARELLEARALPGSHGEEARRRFGVGGIVGEALDGLPSLFEVALPAWRAARGRGLGDDSAAFLVLARLMQTVEDTTALHRCGEAGLEALRRDGAALEARLLGGDDPVPFLRERNVAYRAARLTMGGVADLLGVALGLLVHEGALDAPA